MSDSPTVIQGRLGWEDGDVSEADPEELKPHPKNTEIYGDTDDVADLDDAFLESVREKGVLEPLVITNGKEIISGHRRWLAAKDGGLESVPVRYSEFDDELTEREALIEFNRQREKTPGQVVNEFEEMLEIEKERARGRTKAKGNQHEGKETFPDHQTGQARDKAAEKVNADVSGRTLEKGKTVKDKAESDEEPEAVREAAQEAWDGLQSGDESFNSAYQEVRTAEEQVEQKQQREENKDEFERAVAENDAVEIHDGDFRAFDGDLAAVDHIVTDPPYDEAAIELWAALGELAANVLPDGGFLVAYSGKAHLPDVLAALSEHLNYYWQGIVRHKGAGAKIFSRKLRTNYKPVVVYQKGDLQPQESFVSDVVEGAGREKDAHDWQQAEAEAAELLERFTEPNDTVLDPMCGSGTTGVAALRSHRRAVLIDKDPDAVAAAKRRVADES
jgi:16S rRNA G966 N2-methylase RsmD